jgi:hypothetical protein
LKVNADGSWTKFVNVSAYLKLHPTKNPEPDDFEPDGTWYNLIAADGVLYQWSQTMEKWIRLRQPAL